MVRKIVSLLLVAGIVSAMVTSCAKKREIVPLSDVQNIEDNKYSCSFDGVDHDFTLYLPENTAGAPLVIMLHGAGESGDVMRRNTGFEEDAVPAGYVVCYVTGAVDPGNSSYGTGWNSGTADGENDDCGFLVSLATYLEDEYKLDTKRTYAVGFSNGAFMTYRLAVEAPDIFEAVVSCAGYMPLQMWEKKEEKSSVSIFEICGENDAAIPKNCDGTAASAIAPAIEDVISYWTEADGLEYLGEETVGNSSTLTRYGNNKNIKVWYLYVSGGYHSWPQENITGIDTNALILEFLEQ